MVALNEILGVQHRVILNFTAGSGFTGIAGAGGDRTITSRGKTYNIEDVGGGWGQGGGDAHGRGSESWERANSPGGSVHSGRGRGREHGHGRARPRPRPRDRDRDRDRDRIG